MAFYGSTALGPRLTFTPPHHVLAALQAIDSMIASYQRMYARASLRQGRAGAGAQQHNFFFMEDLATVAMFFPESRLPRPHPHRVRNELTAMFLVDPFYFYFFKKRKKW